MSIPINPAEVNTPPQQEVNSNKMSTKTKELIITLQPVIIILFRFMLSTCHAKLFFAMCLSLGL